MFGPIWPEKSDFNFPLYTNFPDSENYITDYGRFLHKVPAGSPILEGFLLSYLIYDQIFNLAKFKCKFKKKKPKKCEKITRVSKPPNWKKN